MKQKHLTEQQKQDLHLRAVALGEVKGETTGYPSKDKPWLKYYSKEAIEADLPECTMYEYILKQNHDNLDRVAMNYYGANTTYGKMFQRIDSMAGSLQAAGIGIGETVTVCMVNGPYTVCLLFALNKIGAVANMVYGADTPEELLTHLIDAHSTTVFTLDMFLDKFVAIADKANLKRIIVTNITMEMAPLTRLAAQLFKGMKPKALPKDVLYCEWKKFFKQEKLDSRTCHDGSKPAVITYSGGTTGGSKGVILSSKAVISVAHQYSMSEKSLRRESKWMQVLPLFIAYGITSSMFVALTVGMTQIVRIPMTESIADFCKKFKPNHILYGPIYWEAFADQNESIDLSGFIAPTSGGDAMRPAVEKKINDYLLSHGCSCALMNGYGMTEVGAGVSINFPHAYKFGSVGIPFAKNVVMAIDVETEEELPYGQAGELCINAPSAMIGYLNNDKETQNIIRLHKDGKCWVHSGDLGYVDQDGFIFINGRLKRYFIHVENGVQKKIFSLDIEKVLLQHPYVENCAVVPLSDSKTVQVPVAYIVLKKDYRENNNINELLTDYCQEHLSAIYRPAKYFFVDHFPLTKIGKVDYLTLEKEVAKRMKCE